MADQKQIEIHIHQGTGCYRGSELVLPAHGHQELNADDVAQADDQGQNGQHPQQRHHGLIAHPIVNRHKVPGDQLEAHHNGHADAANESEGHIQNVRRLFFPPLAPQHRHPAGDHRGDHGTHRLHQADELLGLVIIAVLRLGMGDEADHGLIENRIDLHGQLGHKQPEGAENMALFPVQEGHAPVVQPVIPGKKQPLGTAPQQGHGGIHAGIGRHIRRGLYKEEQQRHHQEFGRPVAQGHHRELLPALEIPGDVRGHAENLQPHEHIHPGVNAARHHGQAKKDAARHRRNAPQQRQIPEGLPLLCLVSL